MPAPIHLIRAERDVHRAVIATRNLGAETTAGLETAETILAEVRHFVLSVADDPQGHSLNESATRLLSSILGFAVEVTGTRAGLNALEAYSRLAR